MPRVQFTSKEYVLPVSGQSFPGAPIGCLEVINYVLVTIQQPNKDKMASYSLNSFVKFFVRELFSLYLLN